MFRVLVLFFEICYLMVGLVGFVDGFVVMFCDGNVIDCSDDSLVVWFLFFG